MLECITTINTNTLAVALNNLFVIINSLKKIKKLHQPNSFSFG